MLKLIVLALVVVAVVQAAPKPEEVYKSRLDSLNIEEIIANDRLFDNHVKCALDKGNCTPDGKKIKEQILDKLPEILDTNCGKCTEDQKDKTKKILKHLQKTRRAQFDELLAKYDPDRELRNKYKEKYSKLADDEGFGDIFD